MRRTALLLAAALALGGCADPYAIPQQKESSAQHQRNAAGPLIPRGQDQSNRGERHEVARNARRPAFAHLPYLGEGIAVDYVDEPTGRLVLLVLYRGGRAHARAAYRRFLARYRDSGRAYLAIFQRAATP